MELLSQHIPHTWLEHLIRLVLTMLCCSLVGINRELHQRPAGLRTHILVGLGACLIMILSENLTLIGADITAQARMGAQVISGIGFLGAGTIITTGRNVKGLTTAASLWATACVGLTLGAGFYFDGILASLIIYFVLTALVNYKAILRENLNRIIVLRTTHTQAEALLQRIDQIFSDNAIQIIRVEKEPGDDNRYDLTLQIQYRQTNRRDSLVQSVILMNEVYSAEINDVKEKS